MLGWLAMLAVLVRVMAVGVPLGIAFVIVSALLAGHVESGVWRVALAAMVCVGAPLLLHWRVEAFVHARKKKAWVPSAVFLMAMGNVLTAVTLAFGFADDVGQALRRHGDWFLGERSGAVARALRVSIGQAGLALEDFEPPPRLAATIVPRRYRRGEVLPVIEDQLWFHPLMGPERALPMYAIRRFGAARNVKRPPECELGHCGVDIGHTVGQPVLAIHDGVVDRVNRNPNADAISGIWIIVSHEGGTVRSRYIHLDSVREDLKPGMMVKGGEMIGRLGRTGCKESGAHLHFGLSTREHGKETYVDPEPFLMEWTVVEPEEVRVAGNP